MGSIFRAICLAWMASGAGHTLSTASLSKTAKCACFPSTNSNRWRGNTPIYSGRSCAPLSLEITREQSLTTWLGRLDAEQRVARFLLRLCERYQKLGYAKDALLLHMSRDDIGSYLALSTETVSRVISRLSRRGLLTVEQRHIGVPDFSRLTQAAAW